MAVRLDVHAHIGGEHSMCHALVSMTHVGHGTGSLRDYITSTCAVNAQQLRLFAARCMSVAAELEAEEARREGDAQ